MNSFWTYTQRIQTPSENEESELLKDLLSLEKPRLMSLYLKLCLKLILIF